MLRRIIDLDEEELSNLLSSIDEKLIGHLKFKKFLKSDLKNFLTLNK